MRPKSIMFFEVFFLIGVAAAYLNKLRTITETSRALDATHAFAMFGGAANVTYAVLALWPAIYLALWFFIARRGSKSAKWIFVALAVVSVLTNFQVFARLSAYSSSQIALIAFVATMQIAAVAMLFRPDAREWFDGRRSIDPDVFR